jgi:predicted dienelactone hydrolase
MFSHGSCGLPTQSTFLWPLLASRGYVVVAPPHPGNTLNDANCSSLGALVSATQERPQDIIFVLTQMLFANAIGSSPFYGMLDANRIGMAGHSFGGYTTYVAVASDPRFKVALPMAPAVPGTPMLMVPSLTMLSELDSYVSNDTIRMAYTDAQAPKYLVELKNTGHFAYSNNCFPSSDCNPPLTLTQDEAHLAVLRWVIPFLERYLAGHQEFEAFLRPPPPAGALLTVD